MNEQILRHCFEIDHCNQRGGRMLSVVDLIEAGTMNTELAAYALAAVGRGASFLVGASPGGAGKTTVMGALLNFVPSDVELAPADSLATIERASSVGTPRQCYICHEIGAGSYYAYLWGEELRAYFDLPRSRHMLATNLHADTFEEARSQICGDNGVNEIALRQMNLMFFLSVRNAGRDYKRRIEEVWESDGNVPHRLVFKAGDGASRAERSVLVSKQDLVKAQRIIDQLCERGVRTIEKVRAFIVEADESSA